MYDIKITSPCSCVKKRKAWNKELRFESFEKAKETADKMIIQGNERFCKRHRFILSENENSLEITVQVKS